MRKETSKYQLANVIRYSADAMFYPFYSLFLLSQGKTEKEIGLILMILPLIAIFVNPLWSLFAKNVNYNKLFAALFSIFEGFVIITLLAFTNIYVIVILTVLLGVFNQPFYVLFESFTTVYTMETKENYSLIRMFGSLGYAIGVLISGFLIKLTDNYIASFFTVFGGYILVAITLFLIKPLNVKQEEKEKGNFKELIKNKNYVLFLIFYIVSVATLFGGDTFWGPYFITRGIDESMFGVISLGVYLIEVVLLYMFSKYGEKIKLSVLMVLIVLFNALRFVIFSFDASFPLLVLSSYLRGFTMAAILYVTVRYLSIYVKKENITLGMIIFGSLKNVFQMIITSSGGFIIDGFSYNVFFLSLAVLSLTAIFFIKFSQNNQDYDIIKKE